MLEHVLQTRADCAGLSAVKNLVPTFLFVMHGLVARVSVDHTHTLESLDELKQ
jgi:hypothetical protein